MQTGTGNEGEAPLALRRLVARLRGPGAPRVRTAVVALGPAVYERAARYWAPAMDLTEHHLGLHVATRCAPHGEVRLNTTPLLAYALELLPSRETADAFDPAPMGAWVWGVDTLLAKLLTRERESFWHRLHGTPTYLPPLVVALPVALMGRFGPPAGGADWGDRLLSLT